MSLGGLMVAGGVNAGTLLTHLSEATLTPALGKPLQMDNLHE